MKRIYRFIFYMMLAVGVLAGLAAVQARTATISLDSPVSFPVDI